jgi:hypothetical protein
VLAAAAKNNRAVDPAGLRRVRDLLLRAARLFASASLLGLWGCNLILGNTPGVPEDAGEIGCAAVPAMPIISRGVPAYASDVSESAATANDNQYGEAWRPYVSPTRQRPVWLAYDLSGVDPALRRKIAVVYYAAIDSYAPSVDFSEIRSNLRDYTVQGSKEQGGALPSEASFDDLVTVRGNRVHSRQHVVEGFSGYNWVRIRITAPDSEPGGNADPWFEFDVHDASRGACDDWIFFGDGLTAYGLGTTSSLGGGTLAQLVEASTSGERFPLIECGGLLDVPTVEARNNLVGPDGWLSRFPGRYVGLGFGYDHAFDGGSAADLRTLLSSMALAVEQAGKVPVVPTIPAAPSDPLKSTIDEMNRAVESLYEEDPAILPGPDLSSELTSPELFSPDNKYEHLTAEGAARYRQAFADWMLKNVYESR